MTDPVTTWVGCLVLVVAPESLSAPVAEAVLRVEQMIYDDPVYVDATRVATATADNPLSGDFDTIASTLYRELVEWGASPSRNPAPSATFCVLVAHPDRREADRLISALANTSQLAELPVLFRIAVMRADTGAEDVDRSEALVPHIVDAIDATAHEVDKTPDFSLEVHQLSRMAASTTAVPGRVPVVVAQPQEPPPGDLVVVEQPEDKAVQEPAPRAPAEEGPKEDGTKLSLRSLVPNAVLDRSRDLLARRKLPNTTVNAINDLSERTDRVCLQYIVFVSEPVKPSRSKRKARTDFAYTLTRSLLTTNHAAVRSPWYVRALSAGRRMRPGRPLPVPELLRHRDFPDQWGEHLDLFDAADDLSDVIERDRSSFRRRGVDTARTSVVFIADAVPQVDEDTRTRLAKLCSAAAVVWVYFSGDRVVEEDQETVESAGVHVLPHHDDLVDELLQLITAPPSVGGPDESVAVPPEPSTAGER